MAEIDTLAFELAIYLHERQHKSKKIAMCTSDLDMANEIVEMLVSKGFIKDDA